MGNDYLFLILFWIFLGPALLINVKFEISLILSNVVFIRTTSNGHKKFSHSRFFLQYFEVTRDQIEHSGEEIMLLQFFSVILHPGG